MTNRERFAGAAMRFDEREIPVLGKVRIRSMDALEYLAVTKSLQENEGDYSLLFETCVVEEDGSQSFSLVDRDMLRGLDSLVSVPLAKFCMDHAQGATSIEDQAKN